MITNPQPQPSVLSESELFDLEVRPSRFRRLENRHEVGLTMDERDALCATVRALQEREKRYARVLSDRLREMNSLGELVSCQDEDGDSRECGACNTCLTATNAALREQLAQVTRERDQAREDLRILTQGRFIQS